MIQEQFTFDSYAEAFASIDTADLQNALFYTVTDKVFVVLTRFI